MSDNQDLNRQITAAERLLNLKKSRNNLLGFTKFTMPDHEEPENHDISRYQPVRHHEVIAAALEEAEAGNMPRLIITMPPRHGKSELASRRFPAWFMGRDPYRQMIFATYNADFAQDFGRSVREIMRMPVYQQIFPGCKLRVGSAAADRIQTEEGGLAVFVGTGGSLTGRGADLLIIDDPIKDREEADSKSFRDKLWSWFSEVAMTRLMPGGRVVIIMTRWHEDDLIGRLTDPQNPCFNKEEAANWKVLALPAIADDDDPMGRQPGEALWPERFPISSLDQIRRLSPRGFSALYQGKPTPEDGDYFKREWIRTYAPDDLPQNLRIYAASDHAVSMAQDADKTCLMCVGVDEQDNIWVLPDLWWRKAQTDAVCDGMLDLMKRNKPLLWWAEKGHISKAIGPFLRKRMQEEHIYCAIDEVTPAKDKQTRAQAIRGRMAMNKVFFPRFAAWWPEALNELMKFPSARHDDFVDTIAHIGMGLAIQVGANRAPEKDEGPKVGTLAWVKHSSKMKTWSENRLKSFWS
ncbi:Archaeophage PsiM2, terminase large subunit [uncultured Caudovirales phage]|uniref:Archaeophage PsiM2, terminase large subunit n=1 Tax=uncultured Caudovirales phage TaxID=2100421 RepID=A0A6J5MSN6_9CAUD|nr:Archaeophage PsiM2, terminase large subunit [uncultured Caudovirales phage]CAB4163362.1 Archaeophage PsiM2, terminase large subunit [uncultured Caudovirales phage]